MDFRFRSVHRTPSFWTPAFHDEDADQSGFRSETWSTRLTTSMIQQNSWSRKRLKNVRTEHSEPVRRRFTRLMRGNTRDASVGLRPGLFVEGLQQDLLTDVDILLRILADHGEWDPNKDSKLKALQTLLTKDFPHPESADLHAVRRYGPLPGR